MGEFVYHFRRQKFRGGPKFGPVHAAVEPLEQTLCSMNCRDSNKWYLLDPWMEHATTCKKCAAKLEVVGE